jgi:hypothetical protein
MRSLIRFIDHPPLLENKPADLPHLNRFASSAFILPPRRNFCLEIVLNSRAISGNGGIIKPFSAHRGITALTPECPAGTIQLQRSEQMFAL